MTERILHIAKSRLANEADLVVVRNRTKQLASLTGLRTSDQTRLLTAVSEVARNALMYAGGGHALFDVAEQAGKHYLQVTVSDSGPGIANVESVLGSELSRAGGSSLAAARRLVDDLQIKTSKKGTTVTLAKQIKGPVNSVTIEKWIDLLPQSAPNTVLEDLQQQNRALVAALDEVQKVSAELEERSIQLQQANQLKAQFLANVSHEIRTPMNAVLGLTNILDKRLTDPEDRRLLGFLRDSASSLLNTINDILDLSKIDEGKLTIAREAFSLAKLIESTVNIFAGQSESRSIRILTVVDPELPEFVFGDINRIRQILLNLIGNALKFSEKGTIHIRATMVWKAQERVRIRVEVQDEGIGIDAEDIEKLFKPFSQLDGSRNRRVSGTGLGLSICKRLTELLDGAIGVESKHGKGSTFWFEIPFEMPESQPVLPPPMEVISFAGKKILLGEDHPVNQMVALSILEELGVKADVAGNGREVLEAYNEQRYDLILMDCQMPEMDGFETTAAIRNLETGSDRHIPIVAVTANAMSGDREHCLAQGMDDYISKPFEQDDLARVLSRWLANNDNNYGHAIDGDALAKRYSKDQSKRLFESFLQDTNSRLKSMQSALDQNQLGAVARDAHALKGACLLLFLKPLANACSELEQTARAQDLTKSKSQFRSVIDEFSAVQIQCKEIVAHQA